MKIAWITPKWPLPVTDGARVATTQLLANLASRGMRVHLYAILPRGQPVDFGEARRELGVEKITAVDRLPSTFLRKIFSALLHPLTPVTLAPYATRFVTRVLTAHLAREKPDLVVYDGLHAAAWSFSLSARAARVGTQAYRAHNVESELWFRAARDARNPLKRLALRFQGILVKRLETELTRRSQFVFPVSERDAEKFKSYGTPAEIRPIPIGVSPPRRNDVASLADSGLFRNLLFVGRLDWPPNRDGLSWILKSVWPTVIGRTPDISLVIVGSGDASWLAPFLPLPGIRLVGQVEKLAPYYEACTAAIVPIFYGSGTRVKAIESSIHGRVCVSTELGVEGIGLVADQTYYRAESAEDWIRALTSLDPVEARTAGERARDHAERVFDAGRISEDFIHSIVGASARLSSPP